MAFFDSPINKIVPKLRESSTGAVDTCKKVFDTIKERNDDVLAFVTILEDRAMNRAKMLDNLSLEEKNKLPLFGIPVAIKDNICTKDVKTTCSSKMLESFVPPYDATVVEKLEKAGAIIVGKTNLDEFAMGSSTETSVHGITRNPRNLDYVPGGSSGGSAAAVAADMVPVALGSDTGGSIRQPASFCGVTGLKPTYGQVSRYGLVAFASSLDQIGPIASYVQDISLLLSVISGKDPLDTTSSDRVYKHDKSLFEQNLEGLKIGLPKEYFGEGLTDEVRDSIETAKNHLKDAGVSFVDVSLPNVSNAIATYYIICTAEASSNLARFDGVKYGYRTESPNDLNDMYKQTRQEGFGEEVKRRIMLGTYVLSSGYYDAYYLKAAKVRTLISQDFDNAFSNCDAIISPVTPSPAFKINADFEDPLQMYLTDIYTVSANLAGIPGISVPCGMKDTLPIGLQIMAPKWHENILVRLANLVQNKIPLDL